MSQMKAYKSQIPWLRKHEFLFGLWLVLGWAVGIVLLMLMLTGIVE